MSAGRNGGAVGVLIVSLGRAFSSSFLPCLVGPFLSVFSLKYRLANARLCPGCDKHPRRTLARSPRAVPWETALPWVAVMISEDAAAVPGRDDRGRGSACAKAVAANTSRGVGTSITARTSNVCARSGAGRRHGARPDDVRGRRPKPGTPRRNVRAVRVSHLWRNHRRLLKLRRRVVTQQKVFWRFSCATGRGAMSRP